MIPFPLRCSTLLLAIGLALGAGSPVWAQTADPWLARGNEVAGLFRLATRDYESYFTPEFLAQVSPAALDKLLGDTFRQHGAVIATRELERQSPESGKLDYTFSDGVHFTGTLAIERAAQHRIVGLWLTPVLRHWVDFHEAFAELPGQASYAAARLGPGGVEPLALMSADTIVPLGSAFKLYVLGALLDDVRAGKRRWSDLVTLKNRWKSAPSGFLADWPEGSQLTLHTLAGLMISQSDNTATDHLLGLLGRERVEAMLKPMGLARPDLDRPLLSTRELFLLKAGKDSHAPSIYAAMTEAARRLYLDGVISHHDRSDITPWETPRAIDQLEWFGSSMDLVRALDWLRHHTDVGPAVQARELLAINPGLHFDPKVWSYVGYKGGSEPGVLAVSFLLRDRHGEWYAVAASWHDSEHPVDTGRFFGLLQNVDSLLHEPPDLNPTPPVPVDHAPVSR